MSALSIEFRIVLVGGLLGSLAACGGASDRAGQTQPANTAGVAGFVPYGTGSFAGFVGSGGAPGGGFPANTGGVYLTGQGGIGVPIGSGGVSFGGAGGFPVGGGGGLPPASGGFPVGGAQPQNTGGGPQGTGGIIAPPPEGGCGQTLPPVTDYTLDGPFGPATAVTGSGPDGNYTMYKPANLGANGFKHPPTTWGNGITTMPNYYDGLLKTIASHGFVVIASNSTTVTAQLMTTGLDWLVQQNDSGELQGKLDTKCLLTIGYSLGGGAAVGAGSHADVIATVSMHGVTGASGSLHAPLLLFTSQTDTFVTASGFVTPTYNASSVQTFYATLSSAGDPTNKGHLIPIGLGDPERAPMVAWMRLWAYGDSGARQFFYGDQCTLCVAPWTNPQRKNWK